MRVEDEIKLPPSWRVWKIREILGKGSFGEVYKAEKTSGGVDAWSAIKVIRVPPDDAEVSTLIKEVRDINTVRTYYKEQAEMYAEEIQTMYSLQGNSNIVSIQDHAVVPSETGPGWLIFIRMELLIPFTEYQVRHTLQEEEIIRLGESMCKALIKCGTKGILHRDIKPANIFVTDDGEFKLGDFGVSKHMFDAIGSYSIKGTFSYMAPEVYNGNSYDGRADLYSLGLVLYKLANHNVGALLDPSKKVTLPKEKRMVLDRRMKGEPLPPPSDCSKALAGVILKACAYRPEDRYRNAQEMLDALTALRKKTGRHGRKSSPLKAILLTVLIAGCGLAAAGFGIKHFLKDRPAVSKENEKQEEPAKQEAKGTAETEEATKATEETEETDATETEETAEATETSTTVSWHTVDHDGQIMWVETDEVINGEALDQEGNTLPSEVLILIDRKDVAWLLIGVGEDGKALANEVERTSLLDVTFQIDSTEETMKSAAKYENNIFRFTDEASSELINKLQTGYTDFTLILSKQSGYIRKLEYNLPSTEDFPEAYTEMKK